MVDINLKTGKKNTKFRSEGEEEEDDDDGIKHIQKYHDCANLPLKKNRLFILHWT